MKRVVGIVVAFVMAVALVVVPATAANAACSGTVTSALPGYRHSDNDPELGLSFDVRGQVTYVRCGKNAVVKKISYQASPVLGRVNCNIVQKVSFNTDAIGNGNPGAVSRACSPSGMTQSISTNITIFPSSGDKCAATSFKVFKARSTDKTTRGLNFCL